MPNERLRLHLEGQKIGGCLLIQRISAGGMAEVYLAERLCGEHETTYETTEAEDIQETVKNQATEDAIAPGQGNEGMSRAPCGRKVAVKVVCPTNEVSLASGLVDIEERFIAEGELLESLDHPHILPVYASGAERGYLYHVMEYVPNGSLADAIYGRAPWCVRLPLSPPDAIEVARQVGTALQYIHEQGIVHRDVKPGNLLVCGDPPGTWSVLLADFGVARRLTGATGSDEQVTGTVAYMAPEEFSGTFSPASDQYSLAVLTYQLLSGHLPFEGSVDEQIAGHLDTIAPSIRLYAENVPWQIEEVLARALEKRPEDRYPSVAAFAAALEQALYEAEAGADEALEALALARATTRSTPVALRSGGVLHGIGNIGRGGLRSIWGIRGIAAARAALPLHSLHSLHPRLSQRQRTLATLVAAAVLLVGTVLALVSLPSGPNPTVSIASRSHGNTPAGSSASQVASATVTMSPGTPTTTPPTPTTPPVTAAVDSASLVNLSTPSNVPAGRLFSFSVTLANTGTSTWSSSDGYWLSCDTERHPVQDCPAGFAATLGNYAVTPGHEVTFRITLTSLSAPGTFLAWMNMAHSNAPFASNDVLVKVMTLSASFGPPPASPTPTIAPPTPTPTPPTSPTPTPTASPPASPTPTTPAAPTATPGNPPTPAPTPPPQPTPANPPQPIS